MSRNNVIQSVSENLLPRNFTKEKDTWIAREGKLVYVLNYQFSSKTKKFTFNVGVTDAEAWEIYWGEPAPEFVDEAMCIVRVRIGTLISDGHDTWWDFDSFADKDAKEVVHAATDFFSQFQDRATLLEWLRSQQFLLPAMQPYIPILTYLQGDAPGALRMLDDLRGKAQGPWRDRVEGIADVISREKHS